MKNFSLFLLLFALAFGAKAQTVQAIADSSFAHHEYVKAYDYYTEALKADRNNVTNLRRAGFCLMNCKGQELNATRFFTDALKLKPNDPVSNYYLGLIYMDAAKEKADQKEKASFKALAASHLKDASTYGSEDAKAAIKDLNGI